MNQPAAPVTTRRGGRLRPALLAPVAAIAVVLGTLSAPLAATAAPAPELAGFDPADIISDEVMFDGGSMTAAEIQSFLQAKVPACTASAHPGPRPACLKDYRQTTWTRAADPMCGRYAGASNERASTIIAKVAKACDVNPKTLLVILQKEQQLVTDTWPGTEQYRKSTGYGCPDTAPCDSQYNGFYNQLYKAAWAMKRYTNPRGTGPGTEWYSVYNQYPVGRTIGILYSPRGAVCGSKPVRIKNKATSSLYYYTPYVPNAAALAAGVGMGDSCSAYGNRNFYLFFTRWFGSTHSSLGGAIGTLYSRSGMKTLLGDPAGTVQRSSAAGGGQIQRFQRGSVYSSDAGTYALTGSILKEYGALGGPGGVLGWPRRAASTRTANGGGVLQAFDKGAVYSSGAGTFAVTGAAYSKYSALGNQDGALGWPSGDRVTSSTAGGGALQAFSGGRIYQRTGGAATVVTGAFLTTYVARGEQSSSLGWPKADAKRVATRGGGTVQAFQTGTLFAGPAGTFSVTRLLNDLHVASGALDGELGWPTGAAHGSTANGGGAWQRFQGGTVFTSKAGGTRSVTGGVLVEYVRRGAQAGTMGWPAAAATTEKSDGGGVVQRFRSGRIYSSKAGTFAVRKDVLAKYLAEGGEAGVLGWPTGNATVKAGTATQRFHHGTITWTAKGGAKLHR